MKLFEMEGFLRGKCIPRDLKVNETNAEYLVRKFAEADAMCAALAAENEKRNTHSEALAVDNAALREVVERMVNQFAMSGISPEEKSINPAKSLMFDAKSALFMPATDAYLAEMRAQGVEMAACALDDVNQFNYANMLDDLAQKLRKGAAQ